MTVAVQMLLAPTMSQNQAAAFGFRELNKQINQFLKSTMRSIQATPSVSSLLTYPVNKIYWRQNVASTTLPDSMGKLRRIKLLEPERLGCEQTDQPPHIRKLLEKCKKTHFDYRPYVLKDGDCKILALELGCDWHDLAIATWDKRPLIGLREWVALIALCCFIAMGCGFCLQWKRIKSQPLFCLAHAA